MKEYGKGFLDGWKKFITAAVTLIFAIVSIINGGGEVDQVAIDNAITTANSGMDSIILGGGLLATMALEILDRFKGKGQVIKE